MKYSFQLNSQIHTIDLHKTSHGYRAVWNGQTFDVTVSKSDTGELAFQIGDQPVTAYWASEDTQRWVFIGGKTFVLTPTTNGERRPTRRAAERGHTGERMIVAPMPGLVRVVQVTEGDAIAKGQTLFVLEAMKMEIRVQAPREGKLVQLNVRAGQSVEREQVLAEID